LRAIPVHEVERVGNRPFDLTLRPVKPRPYERNPPTHWRPAQAIPNRKATKAAAALALMRRIIAQEAASSESANWPIAVAPPFLGDLWQVTMLFALGTALVLRLWPRVGDAWGAVNTRLHFRGEG
jgi:hypothetical protein